MARAHVASRAAIDDTLPMTCTIESSQLVDGHGVYAIRVARASNDPLASWSISKRFREFYDLSNNLKEYGFDFELPKKKLLGNTDRAFMAERQRGLQTFLDTLVKQLDLSNSILVQAFLDPEHHNINYSELALQHVSMFIRSTNDVYQIVEPLPELGWRYNKNYFLAAKIGTAKDERYLLTWCHYGLDKSGGEREATNCLKLLKSLTHPLLVPIEEVYANESGILTVSRYYPKGSLKDHIHQTKPTASSYWKRYGKKLSGRSSELTQIKTYGRLILEALRFIYDNGLAYGHLHSGNILFDLEQAQPIRLLDIGNVVSGVSSKYRGYMSSLKQIRTLEHCDVYAFGRVLYELAAGEECPTSSCVELPNSIPVPVQQILLKILAPIGDLPTIQELLNEPFFQVSLPTTIDRFQLKLSAKAKEVFEQISRTAQARLEGDQTKIKNAERRNKQMNQLMSDEERARRRRERQAKALGQNPDAYMSDPGTSKTFQRSVSVDPLQLSTGRSSPRRPLTPQMSIDIPNTSPTPMSPGAPPPPPPPPPPPAPASAASGDRSSLLSSITDFSTAKLKKAKTNDRSAPKV